MPGTTAPGNCWYCCEYLPPVLGVVRSVIGLGKEGFPPFGGDAENGYLDPESPVRYRRMAPSGVLAGECSDGDWTMGGAAVRFTSIPSDCFDHIVLSGTQFGEEVEERRCGIPTGAVEWWESGCASLSEVWEHVHISPTQHRIDYPGHGGDEFSITYTLSDEYTEEDFLNDCLDRLSQFSVPVPPEVELTVAAGAIAGANIVERGAFPSTVGWSLVGGDGTGGLIVPWRRLKSIVVRHPGRRFDSPPVITVGAPQPGGIQATVEAVLDGQGRLSAVNVVNPGSRYFNPPSLVVPSGGGISLTAILELDTIEILVAGTGYTIPPVVCFDLSEGGFDEPIGRDRLAVDVAHLSLSEFGTSASTSKGWYWLRMAFHQRRVIHWVERTVAEVGEPITALDIAWPGFGLCTGRAAVSGGGAVGFRFAGGEVVEVWPLPSSSYQFVLPAVVNLPAPRTGGVQATAQLTVAVRSVSILNSGSGYTVPPTVQFSGGGGSGAAGYAVLSNGHITQVVVMSNGSGYTTAPLVEFVGGDGSGAIALARMSLDAAVVTNPGSDYDYILEITEATENSVGEGFAGTITIDEDPFSPTFGQVIDVALTNGGTGYVGPTVQIAGPGLFSGAEGNPARPVVHARLGVEVEKSWEWEGEAPSHYDPEIELSWPQSPLYAVPAPEKGFVTLVCNYREEAL